MTIYRNSFDPSAPDSDGDSGVEELRSVLPPGFRRRAPAPRRAAAPAPVPAPAAPRAAAPAPVPAPAAPRADVEAPAPAPAPAAVDPRVQAGIDAASTAFVLATAWARTDRFDRAEMEAARDNATRAYNAALNARIGFLQPPSVLGFILSNEHANARRQIPQLREWLVRQGVDVDALERRAGGPAPDPRIRAAIDAAKRMYVLGRRWARTGQFDRAEVDEAYRAIDPVRYAVDNMAGAAAVPVQDAALQALYVGRYLLEGDDSSARTALTRLRDRLVGLGVDDEALEREAAAAAAAAVPRRAGEDLAKRAFVLATKWARTGEYDRSEMQAIEQAAVQLAGDRDQANIANRTHELVWYILNGRDLIARVELRNLREVLQKQRVNVAELEAGAGGPAPPLPQAPEVVAAAEQVRQAVITAASRVFVLAKRWERTGQYDNWVLAAVRKDARVFLDVVAERERGEGGEVSMSALLLAANFAYDLPNAIRGGRDRDTTVRTIALLREELANLGVDVAALEREAEAAPAPAASAAPAPVPVPVPAPAAAVAPAITPRRAGWAGGRAVVLDEGAAAAAAPAPEVQVPPEQVQAALALVPRGDAWVPRDVAQPAPDLGPTPSQPEGRYEGKDQNQRRVQWAKIMRFAPRTAVRLGIADQVRAGKLDNYLGSGVYASAFALSTGQVFKLTFGADDAYILWRISQQGRPLPGLIDVYTVFRIDLPFEVYLGPGMFRDFGSHKIAYGVVTERVVVGDNKNNPSEEFKAEARRQGMSDGQIQEQLSITFEALEYAYANKTDRGKGARAKVLGADPKIQSRLRLINEGAAWCDSQDIDYWMDFHSGNYAASVREGQIVPVKSDIGFGGINIEEANRRLRVGVPLAKNRPISRYKASRKLASNRRTSRGKGSRKLASNRRTSRRLTSNRRTSRGRFSR